MRFCLLISLALIAALGGCVGYIQRDSIAAKARTRMVGMSKEDVLSCMGPPRKKAEEGSTEVWSYTSTDGQINRDGDRVKTSGYEHLWGESNKNFCTVNVVMKEGTVKAVRYLGPRGTRFYSSDDQCGYAVEACAE